MMTAANALLSLGVVVTLVSFFYGPWQEFWTAVARQRAFEIRDAIFDLAADGKLKFGSDEYRIIRSSMEEMIRFAHKLNWANLLIGWLIIHRYGKPVPPLTIAIAKIGDPIVRAKVAVLVQECYRLMAGLVLIKSIVLLPLALVVKAVEYCGYKLPSILIFLLLRVGERIEQESKFAG
jgi:hypothetical protein